MNNSKIEELVSDIKQNESFIDTMKADIKVLYQVLNDKLQASSSVVTKEIEGIYKEIDSSFNKKSIVEVRVLELKKELNSVLFS